MYLFYIKVITRIYLQTSARKTLVHILFNIQESTIRLMWLKRGILQFQTVGTLTVRSRSAHGQLTVREIILNFVFIDASVHTKCDDHFTHLSNIHDHSCEEYLTQKHYTSPPYLSARHFF